MTAITYREDRRSELLPIRLCKTPSLLFLKFMPHRLQQHHWTTFSSIPFVAQGAFGRKPSEWAAGYGIASQGHPLPSYVLTRQQVRDECRNPDRPVLHGYICVMSWGLQGAAGRGTHATAAWANRIEIERRLMLLKAGGYTRQQAYDLFATDPIPGLGPSFFTKLVYFFRSDAAVGYIMDQWSGKSINLITGQHLVRISGDAPTSSNTGENYDSYCRVVEFLAAQEDCTGDELEQRLFSQNGLYGRQRGAWRNHVRAHWATGKPTHRYNHDEMMAWADAL
ncbi:hypothetical protein P3T16_005520 [Paraburkholderia sp. GAS42]